MRRGRSLDSVTSTREPHPACSACGVQGQLSHGNVPHDGVGQPAEGCPTVPKGRSRLTVQRVTPKPTHETGHVPQTHSPGPGWERGRGPGPGLGVRAPLAGHGNRARPSLCLGFLTYRTKTIIMVPSSWVTGAGPGCREVPAGRGDRGSRTRAAHRSYPSSSHSHRRYENRSRYNVMLRRSHSLLSS